MVVFMTDVMTSPWAIKREDQGRKSEPLTVLENKVLSDWALQVSSFCSVIPMSFRDASVRAGSPCAPDQRLTSARVGVLRAQSSVTSWVWVYLPLSQFNWLSLLYANFSVSLCESLSLLVFLSLFPLTYVCTRASEPMSSSFLPGERSITVWVLGRFEWLSICAHRTRIRRQCWSRVCVQAHVLTIRSLETFRISYVSSPRFSEVIQKWAR